VVRPRLPGRTGARVGPDQTADSLEWFRARRDQMANQQGWYVATYANEYWPGIYQLSERPLLAHLNRVHLLPYQKVPRDTELSYARTYNNKASDATLHVGIYELIEHHSVQLRTEAHFDLNKTGYLDITLPRPFTLRQDRQYFFGFILTGTVNTAGPQIAISHINGPPLAGILEVASGEHFPSNSRSSKRRAFPIQDNSWFTYRARRITRISCGAIPQSRGRAFHSTWN